MSHTIDIPPAIRGESRSRGIDAAIGAWAALQHGVISRPQLEALGMRKSAIDRRIAARRLHTIHAGVFAVGHKRLTRLGRWMAVVLAGPPATVLSHASAAALWRIKDSNNGKPSVTARPGAKRRSDIVVHRSLLPFDEVTTHEGIPVTTVARTILDVATTARAEQIERMLREADFLRLDDAVGVDALLERYPKRAGTRTLREARRRIRESSGRTRTELEERFKALISKANLPAPEVNATLELGAITIEPDFLWREHNLIVELDGDQAHGTKSAFEADRARDRAATLAGFRVIRATWLQLRAARDDVTALLAQ
jgi:very-short-patch-repair endonuclease